MEEEEEYEEPTLDDKRRDEFLEKKQMIEYEKQNAINYDNAKQTANKAKSKVQNEFNSILRIIKDNVTPEFVHRMRFKKQFPAKVLAAEEPIEVLSAQVETTIEEEKRLHDAKVLREGARKKKLKKGKAHNEIQQTHTKEAKKVEVKIDFRAARERIKAQVLEKQAQEDAIKKELEEKTEKDAKKLREWRKAYWTSASTEIYQESKELKDKFVQQREKAFDLSLKSTYDEWAERDISRIRMQTEAPILSGKTTFPSGQELGIFGIPMEHGAFHALGDSGGHDPVIDQTEIHILGSYPQTEYEDKNIIYIEQEAEVKRNQSLYDVLRSDVHSLDEALERLCSLRDASQRELKQLENEQTIIDRNVMGPPRSFPAPNQITATHIRKNRLNEIKAEIEKYQHAIDVSDMKKRKMESEMLSIAKKLAIARENYKKNGKELAEQNKGLGALPVIVGRNITKVAGLGEFAKPKEMLNAITQQSKIIGIEDQSKHVLKVHRESVAMERDLWLQKQGTVEVKLEVEKTLNKLANISERLKSAHYENSKLSIIEALKAYHFNRTKLNPTISKITGSICWWRNRKAALCKAIEPYEMIGGSLGGITFDNDNQEDNEIDDNSDNSDSDNDNNSNSNSNSDNDNDNDNDDKKSNDSEEDSKENENILLEKEKYYGISLKKGKNSGFVVGTIQLSRPGVWSISLIVARKGSHSKYISKDENDFVIVRLGHNLQNLKLIGTYYNRINPETGAVLYDIKYLVRGNTLGYRFEFSSSSLDPKKHLFVSSAIYEEYEMLPLEIVDVISGREKVLSSYVKMLRLEETQGKMRLTKLLEELLTCEDSNEINWDSEIIQHYPQRYTREYFLRILRAEILVEKQRAATLTASAIEEWKDPFGLDTSSNKVGLTEEQLEKLHKSEERFVKRKQETQYPKMHAARDLVGKRIDIYKQEENTWITVRVHNCIIKWVEGGHILRVRHKVQELNKYDELIGPIFETDLMNMRFVESKMQVIDSDLIENLKEYRTLQSKLDNIELETKQKIKAAKKQYKKHYKISNSTIRDLETRSVNTFQSSINDQLNQYLNSPDGLNEIEILLPDIKNDIIYGKIKPDSSLTLDEQTYKIAKERVTSQWKEEERDKFERQLERQTKSVRQQVGNIARAYSVAIDQIRSNALKEKIEIEKELKNLLKTRKDTLMNKVKFNPKDFSKALSKAPMCEHIKAKAWGDSYNTGVKCLQCGKELTELYKEESQLLGYGSGCSEWLADAINRHRANEAAYRFKHSNELILLDKERLRLEKERREIELSEEYFYDFQDLQAVYEFDRRHAKDLKANGIFRQGLQWTPTELEYFEQTKIIQEMSRLEREGIYLGNDALKNFDPLNHIENPPPTFRALDERHKAQYRELMYIMGRMNNFNKRITDLKKERIDLLHDQAMYSYILVTLHKESFIREHELVLVEADLERTGRMLETYQKMYKLWSSANEILKRAIEDKKRAEMRRCGLWEEIQELRDEHTIIHVETRELLKIKFTHDIQVNDLVISLTRAKQMTEKLKILWEEEEQHSNSFQYCMPGNLVQLKYGLCEVVMYRHIDQMLMILLPFGQPRARAWIQAREVINNERNKQLAEIKLMNLEDINLKEFYSTEKKRYLQELYQMRIEERACRERWEVEDLEAKEDGIYSKSLEKSLYGNYLVTQTPQFIRENKLKANEEYIKKMTTLEKKIKEYKGPESTKPKNLSPWKRWKLKRSLATELTKQFILKEAAKDRNRVTEEIIKDRKIYLGEKCVEDLMFQAINEIIHEVATESFKEGHIAKLSAEVISGIFFPTPVWMQYSTYCLLRDMWKKRKVELKNNIQIGLGSKQKFDKLAREDDPNDENALKLAERKRLQKLELKRQKQLCDIMTKEEERCRKFYHWELKENLRERRQMKEEERLTRNYMKELAAIEEALKNKYVGVSKRLAKQEERKAGVTDKLRRRNDLKDLTMERRKQREELTLMRIEDALSLPLRDIDKKERQKKLLAQQLGLTSLQEINETNNNNKNNNNNLNQQEVEQQSQSQGFRENALLNDPTVQKGRIIQLPIEVPDWLDVPKDWDKMTRVMQNKYVIMHQTLKILEIQANERLRRDKKLLDVVKKKNLIEWKERANALNMRTWQAELAYMVASEECKEAENNLIKLNDNVRKLTTFCQQKGEEELKLMTIIKEKEMIARKRDYELEEALKWLEICEHRSKIRSKLKRRIESDCLWVDTDCVLGFLQRFRTERLRKRLYWIFFRDIVYSIICRAEIIATERKLLLAQEGLSQNRELLLIKTNLMKNLWREYQREELMRTKRSAINKKFFPKMRRATLYESFTSWVRFYWWNRGHREAFEMKYEILKHKLDIERQYKKQLQTESERIKQEEIEKDEKKSEDIVTAIQKHRDRAVECKFCHLFYLESQNTSISCYYHFGTFSIACPKSCTNPGLSPVCIAHRKRRWTCCDSGDHNAIGCARKYHVPVDSDPIYDDVMNQIIQRDIGIVNELNEKLQKADEEDWIKKARDLKRGQVASIEKEIHIARSTAERYHNLKFA